MMNIKKNETKMHLDDETFLYLDEYRKEHQLTRTAAIETIVKEHKNLNNKNNEHIMEMMADKVYERLNNDLVRIRLGANAADKNTQILLEMLNLLILKQEAHLKFKPTEVLDTPVYVQATEHVTNRIAKYKQRKDSKNT